MWKYWVSYVLSLILGGSLFLLLVWVFKPAEFPFTRQTVDAPVPSYLTLINNKEVRFLDLWTPIIKTIYGADLAGPQVSAKAVLMFDTTTGKTLYDKNPRERLPMASLTKIMTAIIALENRLPDDKYIVTPSDVVGEDSMGLSPGETVGFQDLLYGLLLPSGNDAAETLATNFPEGRKAFINAMNQKAKALGLTDTHFTNPSGLQGDGDQYTTPYDLLIITRYALENFPLFAKVVSTYEHDIPATETHKFYRLINETNLLTTYKGVKGVKTGYTPEAGYCLVTYLDYKSHKIIGILLGSEDRRDEMKNLLDFSLRSLKIIPPLFPR